MTRRYWYWPHYDGEDIVQKECRLSSERLLVGEDRAVDDRRFVVLAATHLRCVPHPFREDKQQPERN